MLALDLTTEGERVVTATVSMDRPVLELAKIPVAPELLKKGLREHDWQLDAWTAVFLSMGNPH